MKNMSLAINVDVNEWKHSIQTMNMHLSLPFLRHDVRVFAVFSM